jgi:hypothetical protein
MNKEPRVGKPVALKPLGTAIKNEYVVILYAPKRAGKSTMSREIVEKLRATGIDAYSVHGDLYVNNELKYQLWRDNGKIAIFENHSWNKMKKVFPNLDNEPLTFYLQISDADFLFRARKSMTAKCKKTDEQLLKNKALKDRKGPMRCKYIVKDSDELISKLHELKII